GGPCNGVVVVVFGGLGQPAAKGPDDRLAPAADRARASYVRPELGHLDVVRDLLQPVADHVRHERVNRVAADVDGGKTHPRKVTQWSLRPEILRPSPGVPPSAAPQDILCIGGGSTGEACLTRASDTIRSHDGPERNPNREGLDGRCGGARRRVLRRVDAAGGA